MSRNVSFASDDSTAYREHNPPAVLRKQEAARREMSPPAEGGEESPLFRIVSGGAAGSGNQSDAFSPSAALRGSGNTSASPPLSGDIPRPSPTILMSPGGSEVKNGFDSIYPIRSNSSSTTHLGDQLPHYPASKLRPFPQVQTQQPVSNLSKQVQSLNLQSSQQQQSPATQQSPLQFQPPVVTQQRVSSHPHPQLHVQTNGEPPAAVPVPLQPQQTHAQAQAEAQAQAQALAQQKQREAEHPQLSPGRQRQLSNSQGKNAKNVKNSGKRSQSVTSDEDVNENRPEEVHILVAVTGSVATIKLPQIIHKLKQIYRERAVIQVVATRASTTFFDANDLPRDVRIWYDSDEWRSRQSLQTPQHQGGQQQSSQQNGQRAPSQSSQQSSQPPATPQSQQHPPMMELIRHCDQQLHIKLRRWADILLVAPCSANTLAKFSYGICDNLLTSIFRVWNAEVPIILAPAMNTHMYTNPVTKMHFNIIAQSFPYVEILKPVEKVLVCGDIGMGGMREWMEIVQILVKRIGVPLEEDEDEDTEGESD